jgi:hypothetical protein
MFDEMLIPPADRDCTPNIAHYDMPDEIVNLFLLFLQIAAFNWRIQNEIDSVLEVSHPVYCSTHMK